MTATPPPLNRQLQVNCAHQLVGRKGGEYQPLIRNLKAAASAVFEGSSPGTSDTSQFGSTVVEAEHDESSYHLLHALLLGLLP
jgi:hypothetical protein